MAGEYLKARNGSSQGKRIWKIRRVFSLFRQGPTPIRDASQGPGSVHESRFDRLNAAPAGLKYAILKAFDP